jgi:hypothetical protein
MVPMGCILSAVELDTSLKGHLAMFLRNVLVKVCCWPPAVLICTREERRLVMTEDCTMPIHTIALPMYTRLVSKTGAQFHGVVWRGTAVHKGIKLVFHDERVYWIRN